MKDYLALKASAGSGKTFALSVRYIALVLRGENINEIVALTFTKKAANEMKERIIATFLDLQNKKGEIKENFDADILLIDEKFEIKFVVAKGEILKDDNGFIKKGTYE